MSERCLRHCHGRCSLQSFQKVYHLCERAKTERKRHRGGENARRKTAIVPLAILAMGVFEGGKPRKRGVRAISADSPLLEREVCKRAGRHCVPTSRWAPRQLASFNLTHVNAAHFSAIFNLFLPSRRAHSVLCACLQGATRVQRAAIVCRRPAGRPAIQAPPYMLGLPPTVGALSHSLPVRCAPSISYTILLSCMTSVCGGCHTRWSACGQLGGVPAVVQENVHACIARKAQPPA